MRLRNQLLALSLLTLLLPWSGWKLVQELENFLRQAEENSLIESAQTIARVLPEEHQAELKLARGQALPLRQLPMEPITDGYITDWPEADQHLSFEAPGGLLKMDLLAGRYGNHYYLAIKVTDPGEVSATTFNRFTGTPNVPNTPRVAVATRTAGKKAVSARRALRYRTNNTRNTNTLPAAINRRVVLRCPW